MISTPFIDNWIVTRGSLARLSIIIYLILWIKDTIRLLSSQTHLVLVINIPFKFLSNYVAAPMFLQCVWGDVSNEFFHSDKR